MSTSQISISTDAHFLRFESCAAILGWFSLNWNGVASAALQLAAWKHTLLGASCAISVGRVLVSEHQKHWSDHEILLSGALFAPLGAVQTQLAAGKVVASRTFAALCASFDTGKTANFCCKRSLDGTPDFLELHPIANGSEARTILHANPRPLSIADKRRELLAEERFFALGRFRRVLSVAAVIGRVFNCGLLAQCLSMDIAHLTSIVQHLACMSALEREGTCASSHQTFRFIDDTLHDAAYRALPLQSRTWLHGQVANCLVRQRDDQNTNAELSAAIAWHFAKSGKALEAGIWCRAAAMDAVVSSTPDLAIAYLQQAYQSFEGAGQKMTTSERAGLCRLLGTQLATVHGNASPEVLATYQLGLQSANHNVKKAGEKEFDSAWGLAGYHLTRGELTKALRTSRNLIAIAERQRNSGKRILALRMAGLTELLLGNLHSAIFNLQICIAAYDPKLHAALRYQYGSDQLALAHAHLAWAGAYTADTILSRKHAALARRQANMLQHAHTNAHVAGVLSLVYAMEGERREARAMDLACVTLAQHYKFPYWEAWSGIVRSSLSIDNEPQRAIVDLYRSVEDYQKTGAKQLLPWASAKAAKAWIAIGDIEQAEADVDRGLKLLQETGIRVFEPELRYWQAQCLMRQGRSAEAASILQKFSELVRNMRVKNILRDEFRPHGIVL